MTTKHTPGPWYQSDTGNHQGLVVSEVDGKSIAVTYDKDDAQIIAAAPDLLAALELVIDHIGSLTGGDFTIIRAAIAKATGEGR